MKSVLAALILIPTLSFASARVKDGLSFASSPGDGVYENEVGSNSCVAGEATLTRLATPEITYRLRVFTASYGSSLIAEMVIVKSVKGLKNLKPAMKDKLSAEDFERVCGVEFLSEVYSGSRINKGMQLDHADIAKLGSLELPDTTSLEDFETLVNQVIKTTLGKEARWSSSDSSGPLVPIHSNSIAETFANFKAATLNSDTTDIVVEAKSEAYPATLLKKIIK